MRTNSMKNFNNKISMSGIARSFLKLFFSILFLSAGIINQSMAKTCSAGNTYVGGKCRPCSILSNCETCGSNTNGCALCSPGYFPESGICKPCSDLPNCLVCNQSESRVCTICADGYFLNQEGECARTNTYPECKTWNNGVCQECRNPYVLVNNWCVMPEPEPEDTSCPGDQVKYQGECVDEYPFAKKHYTPAEANKWLSDDNNNTITLIFKN